MLTSKSVIQWNQFITDHNRLLFDLLNTWLSRAQQRDLDLPELANEAGWAKLKADLMAYKAEHIVHFTIMIMFI